MRNTAPSKKNNSFAACMEQTAAAINSQQFSEAFSLASKAIQLKPDEAHAYHLAAMALDQLGKRSEAIDMLIQNPSINKSAYYYLYVGELLLKSGRLNEAITAFHQSITLQPKDNKAHIGLVHAYRLQGNDAMLLTALQHIKTERALSADENQILLEAYNKIDFLNNHLLIVGEVAALLEQDGFDKRSASNRVGELLVKGYPDIAENPKVPLSHPIFLNTHFISLLSKIPMANVHLDILLTYARRLLTFQIASTGEISDDHLNLCLAIAKQNDLNEYIHFVDDDENEIVANFKDLLALHLTADLWQPHESEALFVVLLMYGPLNELNINEKFPLDTAKWPPNIRDFVKIHLIDRATEIALGQSVPTLTDISSETPIQVQRQYEENPYPRWLHCSTQSVESLGFYIKGLIANISLGQEFFNPKMRILIAGCGTGKQAIETAHLFPNSHITAFDLSRRSLGYAQRKANELGITNIDFFQGDILSLESSAGTYDLIECCGVLHHLVDPMKGWKKLTALLSPQGIMRIDLYSKMARADIINSRSQIAQLNLDTRIESMRAFRQVLLNNNTDTGLFKFRDFYVTSEFRDLLFHTHEFQYSLEEIQAMLNELELSFTALHTDFNRNTLFRHEMPSANILDLSAWNQLENKFPSLFSGMYSFWCQKK